MLAYSGNTMIKYFGYGSNKDLDMMAHMVGNPTLQGIPGKLYGYELCIQKIKHIRNDIPKNSPVSISPREMIQSGFGDNFELYISRPNPNGIITGTIWDLTPEELDLVREWELVDYGMQEEVKALASDLDGNLINVETQAVVNPPAEIDRIVNEENYPSYIVNKDKMLEVADKVRLDYLNRTKSK